MTPDVDVPALSSAAIAPLALRRTVGDTLLGNAYVTSTRTLVAPVHPFDDPHHPGVSGLTQSNALNFDGALVREERVSEPEPVRSHAVAIGPPDERAMREGTVVTLFEAGLHTKESAANALEIPIAEFERLLLAREVAHAVAIT